MSGDGPAPPAAAAQPFEMTLALDAMGGDDAPLAMVQGALDYVRAQPTHRVLLVGQRELLEPLLQKEHPGRLPGNLAIIHASQVIGMAEKIEALSSRPDDSMNRCSMLVKDGTADAMVLCGNTGCSVAAAQRHLRRIPGVKRAGILTPLPTPKRSTWICDSGANSVCRPDFLLQFAEMTAALLESCYGYHRPSVGVLSNGEEEGKGTELTQETLALLRRSSLNVVGNVEGHDIYSGDVDIVVCDGFVGNIVLKTSEGLADGIMKIIKEEVHKGVLTQVGGVLMKPAFRGFRRRTHWSLVGGCPLIGVNGVTIIGHGRSERVAVFHALGQAARCVAGKVIARLREHFKTVPESQAEAG